MLLNALVQRSELYCDPTQLMIVDDRATFRELIGQQLEDRGFKVTSCSNGLELIERITFLRDNGGGAIPVILTEYKMGGSIDGITAARIIRDAIPCVKVILFTSISEIPHRAVHTSCSCRLHLNETGNGRRN
jgi:CheY-like chemotaxis protein